jgi:hypothetical protein
VGRHTKNVEFLNQLKDVMGLNSTELAKASGKKQSNITDYLSGKKPPQKRALRSIIDHLSEWKVTPQFEVQKMDGLASKISAAPGIYALYDSAGNTLYVGQATSLFTEVNQTLQRHANFAIRTGPNLSKKNKPLYRGVATHISIYIVKSARLRHNLEALLLRIFPNQCHNNKLGSFK